MGAGGSREGREREEREREERERERVGKGDAVT